MELRHSRHRRRVLVTGTLLLVPALLLALRYPARGQAVALHLSWMALLVGAALLSGRGRFGGLPWYAAALVSGVAASAVVAITGGTESPRFGFLVALPPIVLVVVPNLPWAAGLAGAACLAGGVAIVVADGRVGWFLVEWVVLLLTTSVLSIVGAIGFRALWARELEAQREHAVILAQLAESERRRERAERLALIARLAARLAHELSNPLAVVKANVAWLAAAGDAAGRGDDGAEVLEETRAGVERIGRVAVDLRQLAEVAQGDAETIDLAEAVAEALDGLAHPVACTVRWVPDAVPRVVANRALLVLCVRHLVAGCDSRAGDGAQPGELCLGARRVEDRVAIELEPCRRGAGRDVAGATAEVYEPVEGAGHANLHLALAAELARALEGTLETLRASDGAWRCRVTVPGEPLPS